MLAFFMIRTIQKIKGECWVNIRLAQSKDTEFICHLLKQMGYSQPLRLIEVVVTGWSCTQDCKGL